jgi:hypothetical protein
MTTPTKKIVVHFRSGRVLTLDAPDGFGSPEEHAELLTSAITSKTMFVSVGGNLIFLRSVEQIELVS